MEAVHGCSKPVTVTTTDSCNTCDGSGAEPGSTPDRCAQCKGTGMETVSTGFFQMQTACRRCGGSGQVISRPCSPCFGQGSVKVKDKITVTIPAGVDNGVNIRLAGEGEKGTLGGPRGNLFVQLEVAPHDFFERDGVHVHVPLNIDVVTAMMGGTVKVPTLDGEETVRVTGGTQPGDTMTLSRYGVRRVNSNSRGDLFAHFKIKIPRTLSPRQRELMEEFKIHEEEKLSPKVKVSDPLRLTLNHNPELQTTFMATTLMITIASNLA